MCAQITTKTLRNSHPPVFFTSYYKNIMITKLIMYMLMQTTHATLRTKANIYARYIVDRFDNIARPNTSWA